MRKILSLFLLLIDLFIPNFSSGTYNVEISTTKMNMHTLQTMLETYAVDWGGIYPENVNALKSEAVAERYWQNVENPYPVTTYRSGISAVLADKTKFDFKHNRFFKDRIKNSSKWNWENFSTEYERPKSQYKGFIIYFPVRHILEKDITKYYIYATDDHGMLFEHNDGVPYCLSNY